LTAKTRAILIIFAGLFLLTLGIGASLVLFNQYKIKTSVAEQQAQAAKMTVVILQHDMKLGDRIEEGDVTTTQMPVDFVPRDALSSTDNAVGRFIKSDMVQGEMVLEHNLADPTNNNHDLSFILSDDHVIMAFPATDLMSRENVIQRGDVIDILATFTETVKNPMDTANPADLSANTPNQEQLVQRTFTVDAFQKVSVTALVLDVVYDSNGNATEEQTISSYLLALSPQDALVLKHLKDMDAAFDVVLRSPTSAQRYELTPVTEEYIIELYGLEILP
jgi:Flp pilus assembly protein CpaB